MFQIVAPPSDAMLSNASLSLLFFIVGLCQVCYCVHGRILRFERQATKEGPAAAFSSSNPSPQSQPQPIAALAQTIPPRFAPQNSQAAANINAANVGAADPLPQFHQRPGPAPTPEQAQEQFFSQHSQPQQQPPLLAQQQVPAQQQQQPLQPPPIAAQQQVGVNPLHQDAGHNQPPPVQQPQLSQPTPPQGQLGSAPPSASSIVVTSSSPTSFTEPTPRIVPPPVDRNVDLDGDGALSLKEVQYAAFVHHGLSSSVVENLFKEVDKNKDGYLNSIEFNEIRPLVLAKAENAALRYTQNVDTDHNGLLSLTEAQTYILREYGISNRDVQRIWRLVVPSTSDEMDAVLFSKLRRRIRGMSIRLARQLMKTADKNDDGRIDLREAQMIAFEQEGIAAGDVTEMLASVDDNNDGELNAPELADFERIVRSRAVETAKRALKVVDSDGSGTVTMDEAKKIAFDHYGFDEATLEPFFAQADENEDGQLDAVEFAGFRSVIRARAVKNAQATMMEVDEDGDGLVSMLETEEKARREDDMESSEVRSLFTVADQDRSGLLDRVELADFLRLIRLSAIKYVNEHFKDYDINHDKVVTVDELEPVVQDRYHVDPDITRKYFDKVDVDKSNDLSAGEIVDFRHEIRRFVADRSAREELDAQSKREMAEIEAKTREGSGTHPRRHPAEQTAAAPDSPTPTTISKESKLRTGAGNSPNKASADKNRENDREEDGAGQAEAGEGEGESEEEEKTNGGGGSRTTSSRPLVVTTEASTVASTSAATTTSTPTTTTTTTEPPTTTTTTTTTEPPATTTTVSNSTAASPPSPTMRKHKKGRAQRLRSSVKHRDQPATPVVVEKVVMLENASHPSPDVARTVPIDEQSPAAAAESHITQLPSTEAPSTDASPSPSEPSTTTQLASIRNTSTAEVGAHRQILREPSLPKDSVDSENSIGERKNKRKHRPRPTQSTAAPITAGTVDESSSSPSTYQRTNPTTQVVTESTAGTVVTDAPIASQTQPSTTIPETIHEGTSPTPHQAESETPSPTVVVIENSTPPTAAENQPSDTSPAIQTLTPEAITPQQQNQPVDVDIADSTAAPPSSTTTHSPMKRRKTKKRKQSTPAAPTTTTITTTATFTTVPSTTEAGTTRGDFARGEEGGTEAEESPTEVFEGGSR